MMLEIYLSGIEAIECIHNMELSFNRSPCIAIVDYHKDAVAKSELALCSFLGIYICHRHIVLLDKIDSRKLESIELTCKKVSVIECVSDILKRRRRSDSE
jgi:hypothetical protein